MAPRRLALPLLFAARRSLAVAPAEPPSCAAGASCGPVEEDVEADSLRVSLLQRKGTGSGSAASADEQRRAELIEEIRAIDAQLEGRYVTCDQLEGSCKRAVEWAKNSGVREHPDWYPGLHADSGCEEFQALLNKRKQGHCPPLDATPQPAPISPHPTVQPEQPVSGDLPYGHPTPGKNYPKHHGFTLWLVEEFDERMDLDNDPVWTWGDGAMSQVRFVKDHIKFENGVMKIIVDKNHGHERSWCSHSFAETVQRTPLLSGEMRTKHNMFRYGRYEMSHKAPMIKHGNSHVNGNYISTMFTYRDLNEHHWREIDWEITADSAHSVTTNMLQADNTIKWRADIQKSTHETYNFINTRENFNEYAFEWLPDRVTWYINNRKIREQRGRIPELSTKIMMNLWIFEAPVFAFGGKQGYNNQYPMVSEYDWFRFYKWDGDRHYPCDKMSPSCLSHDDKYLSGNNPCDGIEMKGHHNGWPCSARCER